jgi:probable biosynthetic protein (TIGR04098 family)
LKNIIKIVKGIDNSFDESQINLPFNELGIDSLDFVTIRVEIDKYVGDSIPDEEWYAFKTINDIVVFCEKLNISEPPEKKDYEKQIIQRDYAIKMPQMANYALSENWLFKELGNVHWELLCKGLGKESSFIKDIEGVRLYATFIRIKLKLDSLMKFKENDTLTIEGEMLRHGKNNYYSTFNCKSGCNTINAELITTFSKREGEDNLGLIRCNPNVPLINIPELDRTPPFFSDYRLMNKGLVDEHDLESVKFELDKEIIFDTVYSINPYYDLNGVGLLYFAAYPIISDYCESKHFNRNKGIKQWENEYFTISRDVFYYANCNIGDKIIYSLIDFEFIQGNRVKIYASLIRHTDKTLMAHIFTIKEKYVHDVQ